MKHWEALGRTRKLLEELGSTRKLLEALENTRKHPEAGEVPGSTKKHWEAP